MAEPRAERTRATATDEERGRHHEDAPDGVETAPHRDDVATADATTDPSALQRQPADATSRDEAVARGDDGSPGGDRGGTGTDGVQEGAARGTTDGALARHDRVARTGATAAHDGAGVGEPHDAPDVAPFWGVMTVFVGFVVVFSVFLTGTLWSVGVGAVLILVGGIWVGAAGGGAGAARAALFADPAAEVAGDPAVASHGTSSHG